jgi:phosphohistidine phosphatase
MKRVIIVRHAKSVHYGYDDDFSRDLTERGIADAEKISSHLAISGIMADLVIASPAKRALHTASIFCENLGYDLSGIRKEKVFYGSLSTQDFVDMLQKLDEGVSTVYVFGHNPTVYYLVYNLVKYFSGDMPTCSTVAIDFPIEKWTEISARIGKVTFQLTPKNI